MGTKRVFLCIVILCISLSDNIEVTAMPKNDVPFNGTEGMPPISDVGSKRDPEIITRAECPSQLENEIEQEIIRGECRKRLIIKVKAAVRKVIYEMKLPKVDKEKLANFVGDHLGKLIDENLTAGNIADAVVALFQIGISVVLPVLGANVGLALRPYLREAVLKAIREVCRKQGCCVPAPAKTGDPTF